MRRSIFQILIVLCISFAMVFTITGCANPYLTIGDGCTHEYSGYIEKIEYLGDYGVNIYLDTGYVISTLGNHLDGVLIGEAYTFCVKPNKDKLILVSIGK